MVQFRGSVVTYVQRFYRSFRLAGIIGQPLEKDGHMGNSGSMEYPVLLHARGLSPINVVVEDLAPDTCRLRAVALFDVGTALAFEFGPKGGIVRLRGRVAERKGNGPRFTYRVHLDANEPVDADALTAAIEQWRRHRELWPEVTSETYKPEGLRRAGLRVATQFRIAFRTEGDDEVADARAADLSHGGLSMSCDQLLVEGALLHLRFTLPTDAVEAASDDAESTLPFEEMAVRARVVWRRILGPGLVTHGLAFCGLDAATRSEIQRYVDGLRKARS
jgi:hypothetical protein